MTAVETTKERWFEADVNRTAGEVALKSPKQDAKKAEGYFERAFAVARQQQAKSWELRAAMSMARLWRSQGKRDKARELLAPVYNWFTEGFDTLDLKEAKALLEELAQRGLPHGSVQKIVVYRRNRQCGLIAFFLLSVNEEPAPWEGCRASSKTEYESAKQNLLLQTSFGAYARTGHW
jgi:hypothetical protein